MDLLSIIGVLVGILAILLGQFLEGGTLTSLMNAPALLIVFGGTTGAVMLETPWPMFFHAIKIFPWVVKPPRLNLDVYIEKIVMWSGIARRRGLLGLETILEDETNVFARKALGLLIDGNDAESIRSVLELDLEHRIQKELQAARVFESMGGYSPTIGIIGAVMGLIHVMGNLSDPSKLGAGIAIAFVATIYGIGFANLFFLPVASKLHKLVIAQGKIGEVIIEGVICISQGENSRIIELKLLGFEQ